MAPITAALNMITARLDNSETREASFNVVEASLDTALAPITAALNMVSARLDNSETRLDARLSNIETRLDARLDIIETRRLPRLENPVAETSVSVETTTIA